MTFEEQQEVVARARHARAEAVSALLVSLAHALRNRGLGLYRRWVTVRTRAELYALSDRTLKDIGIHRSQIDGLFR